jgi:hypothetical protein
LARPWAFLRVVFGRHELKPSSRQKGGGMSPKIVAGIRTFVQVLVSGWIVALGAWLAAKFGIQIDVGAVTEAVVNFVLAVIVGVVTWFLNWLGEKFPVLNRIFSLGASRSGPTY